MASRKKVQNAHISTRMRELHHALLDIVGELNRPQRDDALMAAAGIRLDRALFPLLVAIGRFGPIGVVDLAERAGRDYTTVSRQVAKLETLGLVRRRASAADRRIREAVITPAGKTTTDLVDAARERIGRAVLATWRPGEVADLVRLMRKLADAFRAAPGLPSSSAAAKDGRK